VFAPLPIGGSNPSGFSHSLYVKGISRYRTY
jgi:hypothetical protein